jgi:hypothetical protein
MRVRTVLIVVGAITFCAALDLLGHSQTQPLSEAIWSLPRGLAVKDAGPRAYRFTVEYNSANSRGDIFQRQRFTAEYTRGLSGGEVMWKNVTQATAEGATAPFGTAQKRDFMEGFRYRNDLDSSFRPDFFKGFPPTAIMERNLVWDTGMIEMFGQNYFDHLKLNEPYHAISNGDTEIPAVGRFHNRDVVLEWVGRSKRNGEDCAVIEYQAFFNPIEIAVGGMTMAGRSDYWGQIWVSLATKQIEYATIYERVVAEMKLPDQETPQIVDIFRSGSLESVSAK